MDFAEISKKVDALKAELAAKSSRIAGLEARVSLLEAENAGLRKAVSEGGSGRLEAGLGGSKQKSADISGGHAVNHVIEVSDGEEEEMAVDVNEILDDDDVLITPRGKKCAAARVVSDSESEDGDENDQGHGDGEVGVTSSRKRALRGVSDSDSESEDGSEGARVVNQKPGSPLVTTGIESEDDDAELYGMEGCSTPGTKRRFARLTESQSKRMRPARRELEFFEPKNHEESEDDSKDFIDDSDCSENSADSVEEPSAGPEESDNEETIEDLMARIRGKRNAKSKDWKIEAEMLSAFDEHPELRLKAVCALYRMQTEEEQAEKATIIHNKKGFSQIDAPRGSRVAQFLLDGDAAGPLKKTAQDLEKYDRRALEFCHKMAFRYSKQLFAIYQKKEDPYFP
ncbi:uncharacterized protein [Aegilops tauschii subsp. strangulata]|nr:uncharacterized protein LOC109741925 [Aegilops tauschii subsp. strangulata]